MLNLSHYCHANFALRYSSLAFTKAFPSIHEPPDAAVC